MKRFTWFNLQSKLATKIGWWLEIRILENKIKTWDVLDEIKYAK